jgi:hypothetical protein
MLHVSFNTSLGELDGDMKANTWISPAGPEAWLGSAETSAGQPMLVTVQGDDGPRPTIQFVGGPSSVPDLGTAQLVRVEMDRARNSGRVALGVNVTGVPEQVVVHNKNGQRFGTVIEASIPQPLAHTETIFNREKMPSARYTNSFKGYTAANVDTTGVTDNPEFPIVLTLANHPVAKLMRKNPALLGTAITEHGPYAHVERKTFYGMLEGVRRLMADKTPHTDLSKFEVSIHRADGHEWTDPTNALLGSRPGASAGFDQERINVSFRLKVFYTLGDV